MSKPKTTSKTSTAKKPAAARPILSGSAAAAILKTPSPKKTLAELAGKAAPTTPTEPTPPKGPRAAKELPPGSTEEICVFAIRLTRAERDLIHEVTGPAKASKFVRGLAVAAASGDEAGLRKILDSITVKPAA